jgi:hypothetical protein
LRGPSVRRIATRIAPLALAAFAAQTSSSGCTAEDLGACDMETAQELVYSPNGMVATKGQAIAHDSCGNGVFCHSSGAHGDDRFGAPAEMDFDMLPNPDGLGQMLDHAEDAWGLVESEDMPPRGVGAISG